MRRGGAATRGRVTVIGDGLAVEKGQLVHIYSGKIKQLEKTVVLVLMLEFVMEVFNIDNRHGRCELAL